MGIALYCVRVTISLDSIPMLGNVKIGTFVLIVGAIFLFLFWVPFCACILAFIKGGVFSIK